MREQMPNSIKILAICLGFDGIAYWICLFFLDLPDAAMTIITRVVVVIEVILILLGAVIIIRDLRKAPKAKGTGRKERFSKGRQVMLMAASMLLGVGAAMTMLLCFTDFLAGRVIFTVALVILILLCAFVLLFLSLRSAKPGD